MVKRKRNPMRMLIAVGIAITMLFAIVALSACNTDPTLLQQTDSLGQQVYAAQNGGNPTIAEIDALLAELEELRVEVIRLEGENAALLARIDGYKAQLNELRNGGNVGITAELEARIKQTVLAHFQSIGWQRSTIENIGVNIYGYFNGSVALSMWHSLDGNIEISDSPWQEEVSGVEFYRHSYMPIVIWSADRILSITEAFYEYEFLTIEDLKQIQTLCNWN